MNALRLLLHGLSATEAAVDFFDRPRAVLAAQQLLLPAEEPTTDKSRAQRLRRAAVAHAAAHLRHSRAGRETKALKPLAQAVVGAIEDARVERLLVREYPGVRGWFLEFLTGNPQPRGLDFASLLARLDRVLAEPALQDDNHWVHRARDLFLRIDDLRDAEAFRRLALVLANELGQMRVPFDPQACVVPAPYRDDNAYLWDHGRTAESGALPQAGGAGEDMGKAEPWQTLRQCHYAEWDHRRRRLRNSWCTVLEDPAQRLVGVNDGRDRNARLPSHRTVLRAQATGEDIDLSAAVAGLVDLRRGAACDTRWFLRRPRASMGASVLLLLDLSESTLDCLGASTATVLDAEKAAALTIARHLLAQGHRVAIHGFSSNTRAAVRYRRVLEFGAALDETAVEGVRSLAASHSTRLGAALRHALDCAAADRGDRRAVLVLTDGAPSDIDVFDADYLVQDARMAAAEARRQRIRLGCIAFDPRAQGRLRTIFGWRYLHLAGRPTQEPRQLWRFCEGTLIA